MNEKNDLLQHQLTDPTFFFKVIRQFVNNVSFNTSLCFMCGVHFSFYSLYFHHLPNKKPLYYLQKVIKVLTNTYCKGR